MKSYGGGEEIILQHTFSYIYWAEMRNKSKEEELKCYGNQSSLADIAFNWNQKTRWENFVMKTVKGGKINHP